MKSENEKLIGKVLTIDQNQIDRAELHLKTKVIPAAREVIEQYRQLDSLPAFTPKVWDEIVSTDGKSIAEAFANQAKKDTEGIKNSSIKSQLLRLSKTAIEPFLNSVKKAKQAAADKPMGLATLPILDVYLADIGMSKDCEPFVKMDRIKEACTLKIETEAQAELYRAGKAVETAFAHLKKVIEKSTRFDMARINWVTGGGQWGLFWEPQPGNSPIFDVQLIGEVIEIPSAEPELIEQPA